MNPEPRPATAVDIAAFYDGPQEKTMRAWAWTLDGEPIALAGIIYHDPTHPPVLFSALKPEMKRFPRTIVRGARAMLEALVDVPMLTLADREIPGSARLLTRLGFRYAASTADGDIYQFTPGARA